MMIGELMSTPPMTIFAGFKKSSNMRRCLDRGLDGHAMVQELGEHGVEVIAGSDQRVIDASADAAAADFDQVFLERLQIAVAERARVAEQVRQLLHALEARAARKWERQL